MPYDLVTPFGVRPGQVSPEEEMNQRTQMSNMQLMAQAQIEALRGQNQKDIYGNFGQRSQQELTMQQLHDQAARDLVGAQGDQQVRVITAGQAPEMGRLGMEQQLFQEGGPVRQAEAQGRLGQLDFRNQIQHQIQMLMPGGSGGAANGVPSQDALDAVSVLGPLMNGQQGPDMANRQIARQMAALGLQDQKENRARTRSQQFLESGQVPEAKAAASEGGIALPLPQVEDFEGKNPTFGQDLGNLADSFATRDASTVGWNPTDADIAQVKNERDRTAQILLNHGYDQATAIREANRKVAMSPQILAHQNDVNAGWIQKLKAALGIP